MKEAKKAIFDFETYRISKFSFIEVPKENLSPITLGFSPSGRFFPNQNRFEIDLTFSASLDNDQGQIGEEIINVLMQATFTFNETLEYENIPEYFYRNSLAIIFPFLRAFISTLTFQANIKPIILPILNLTNLETPLKENIQIIQD